MTYLIYNSVTSASRIKKFFGDKVKIEHISKKSGLSSCGYALVISDEKILEEAKAKSEELEIEYDIFR